MLKILMITTCTVILLGIITVIYCLIIAESRTDTYEKDREQELWLKEYNKKIT